MMCTGLRRDINPAKREGSSGLELADSHKQIRLKLTDSRSGGNASLFLESDAERLHLAIEIAALQAQQLRRAAHIAVGLF